MQLDLLDDAAHQIDRDGEADALGFGVLVEDRRVDTDELAKTVDQGAARAAAIDRGVGLDEIGERDQLVERAARRAHDALAHGGRQPVGIAD